MNILYLPFDILDLIFKLTDGYTRSKCEGSCKIFYKIASKIILKTDNPEKDREVKLIALYQNSFGKPCLYGHTDLLSCQKSFNKLCLHGHIDLLPYYSDNINYNFGMTNACEGGHIDIVKYMIKCGADEWNWGMSYACANGRMNIAKLMIKHGADDWNWFMIYARKGDHTDIIKILKDHGAKDRNENTYKVSY